MHDDSRLSLINNDQYLHIVGGNLSKYHYIFDLKQLKLHNFDSFKHTKPNICGHGLIYNDSKNTLIMFGGWKCDDFYVFDLNSVNNNNSKWILDKTKK